MDDPHPTLVTPCETLGWGGWSNSALSPCSLPGQKDPASAKPSVLSPG